jgi:hypothetical protein
VRRRLDRDLTREEWDLYVGPEPYAETRARASTRVRARVAPAVAITG